VDLENLMAVAQEVMEEAQADMAVVAQDGQSQSHLDGVQEVQDHHTVEAQVVMEEVQVDMEEAQEDMAVVAPQDGQSLCLLDGARVVQEDMDQVQAQVVMEEAHHTAVLAHTARAVQVQDGGKLQNYPTVVTKKIFNNLIEFNRNFTLK
jgi:hypothetical protein